MMTSTVAKKRDDKIRFDLAVPGNCGPPDEDCQPDPKGDLYEIIGRLVSIAPVTALA